ncbi:MAG: carbohydrate kinase, partial [Actinomycetales bacterium]
MSGAQRISDVLVVGEALVDVVRRPGEEDVVHAGGSPFNVAVGLGRLGVSVELGAQVGADEHGELLRGQLDRADVLLADLAPPPSRTSSAVAVLADDGSASYAFDLTWDPAGPLSASGRTAVHVGSLGIAIEPGATTVSTLVADAAAQGVVVSLDPNVRLSVEPDHARWRELVDRLLPSVTVLKMSDEDAEVLYPGRDLAELVAELAAPGRVVAVTRGGDGAVLGSPAGVVE